MPTHIIPTPYGFNFHHQVKSIQFIQNHINKNSWGKFLFFVSTRGLTFVIGIAGIPEVIYCGCKNNVDNNKNNMNNKNDNQTSS